MTLSDLISRLSAAQEGSRELDGDVSAAIGENLRPLAPRYTTSLNAALTLVPEGYDWRVIRRTGAPYQGRWPYEAVVDTGDILIHTRKRMTEDFADTVLRYRPKPKSEPAKQRKRKAAKFAIHQYPDPRPKRQAGKTRKE